MRAQHRSPISAPLMMDFGSRFWAKAALSLGPAVSNSFARFAYALLLPAMRWDDDVVDAANDAVRFRREIERVFLGLLVRSSCAAHAISNLAWRPDADAHVSGGLTTRA